MNMHHASSGKLSAESLNREEWIMHAVHTKYGKAIRWSDTFAKVTTMWALVSAVLAM